MECVVVLGINRTEAQFIPILFLKDLSMDFTKSIYSIERLIERRRSFFTKAYSRFVDIGHLLMRIADLLANFFNPRPRGSIANHSPALRIL
jgi:hypothetical protein